MASGDHSANDYLEEECDEIFICSERLLRETLTSSKKFVFDIASKCSRSPTKTKEKRNFSSNSF